MSWLLPIATLVLLFLAVWIVIPAPNMFLLPLGVGAPEVSPLLLVAAIVLAALAFRRAVRRDPEQRRRGTPHGLSRRIARALALITVVVTAWPLVQLPFALRRFDEAMTAVRAPARAPDVATAEPRVMHDVLVASPEGQRLTAEIYRPPAGGPFPILVQIYGGSWQRGAPANDAEFARHFASRGYVVVAIDYRHAPKWQWPAQIEDVRTALTWIAAHASEHGGDATRMAIIGRSAGAHLALLAAYQQLLGPRVSAVVSYYGPTDLAEGWRRPPRPDPLDVRAVLETLLGGTPDQVPDRYRDASPITYVSANVPPTLLVYGARDHIVEARFGLLLHERLRAAGAISVLLEIPWAEHAFDALPTGLSGRLALSYTERFLDSVLKSGN